jgi:AcrR family transcriptional regulator
MPQGADSRTGILNVAEAAFARNGYDATSFSDICEAAGVSRGLPSYLFGNKESLYRAVVERAADKLRASTIEPLLRRRAQLSVQQAVELFVDTYTDYLAKNRSIVRLLQWEMVSDRQGTRPFAPTSQLFGELHEILDDVLKRHHARLDAGDLLASITALCFFPFMLRVKYLGLDPGDKIALLHHKRRILQLLLHGIGN